MFNFRPLSAHCKNKFFALKNFFLWVAKKYYNELFLPSISNNKKNKQATMSSSSSRQEQQTLTIDGLQKSKLQAQQKYARPQQAITVAQQHSYPSSSSSATANASPQTVPSTRNTANKRKFDEPSSIPASTSAPSSRKATSSNDQLNAHHDDAYKNTQRENNASSSSSVQFHKHKRNSQQMTVQSSLQQQHSNSQNNAASMTMSQHNNASPYSSPNRGYNSQQHNSPASKARKRLFSQVAQLQPGSLQVRDSNNTHNKLGVTNTSSKQQQQQHHIQKQKQQQQQKVQPPAKRQHTILLEQTLAAQNTVPDEVA